MRQAHVNPVSIISVIAKNFADERARWMLWAPVGMGAGIVVYFSMPFEPPLWALAITPAVGIFAWFIRHYFPAFVAAFALFTFVIGFNAAQLETRMEHTVMLEKEIGPLPLTGQLMMTEVMPDGVRLTLKYPKIGHLPPNETPDFVRIRMDGKTLADTPPPGTLINILAQVGPYGTPAMPDANDFRRQSYFRHWGGVGWSRGKIEIVDPDPPPVSWRDKFSLAFEHARITLAQHVYARLSGDVAAMTAARMNGEQTAISEPVIEAMRIAGLAHLLSTSGFHVTIMGLLVYFPLRMMLALIPWIALRFNIKKIAAFAAIFSALGYTLLVGSQAATMRSMLMVALAMLAILVDRRAAPLRIVMLSAALGMLISPDALLGPSFQMSFAAVFCLIAFNEKAWAWTTGQFEHVKTEWLHSFASHMWAIIRTSLIATAATTPFTLHHFETFSFYGFAANALAIPLTSFWVMPCILMAYLAAPFGLDGWFITGAGWGIGVTIWIAQTVAAWPYSIFYLPVMPGGALIAVTLGVLWLCIWQKRWRFLGLLPILIGAAYPLYTPLPDVIVSPDGKEWAALLDDGRLAVSNLDREKFIVTQWQQRLGNVQTVDVTELSPAETQVRCDDMGCVYRHGGHVVAFPILGAAAIEDCRQANMVIAPFRIADCAAETVIDEHDFWKHGAYAVYFKGDAANAKYAQERRGERPWDEGYAWRVTHEQDTNLPEQK